jgi:hypothetical protein
MEPMLINRGMDLTDFSGATDAEIGAFRDSYRTTHGRSLAAYDFWLEFDPTVVKTHRLQAHHTGGELGRRYHLAGTLGFLHLYVVMAYEEGIRYEVHHSRSAGATRREVLQVLEIAFAHSGPRGIDAAAEVVADVLRAWPDGPPSLANRFPSDWLPQPDFFALDFDLETDELSAEELRRYDDWRHRTLASYVPNSASWMSLRPGLLKSMHARIARAMTGPLPAQILPFMQLQMHTALGDRRGIQESIGLGLALSMTSDQLAESIAWGALYSGPSGAGNAYEILDELTFGPSTA